MTELEQALRHLIRVWAQYGEGSDFMADRRLHHLHMLAGQEAGDFLIERGLATDAGESVLLTEAGKMLMEREP